MAHYLRFLQRPGGGISNRRIATDCWKLPAESQAALDNFYTPPQRPGGLRAATKANPGRNPPPTPARRKRPNCAFNKTGARGKVLLPARVARTFTRKRKEATNGTDPHCRSTLRANCCSAKMLPARLQLPQPLSGPGRESPKTRSCKCWGNACAHLNTGTTT